MKCESICEELQAFLDDELGPEERERVASHAAECSSCRETLKALRGVSGVLGTWVVPEPTALPTARELLARASSRGGSSLAQAGLGPLAAAGRFWSGRRNRLAAAAAAVLVCALGIVSLQILRSPELTDTASSVAPGARMQEAQEQAQASRVDPDAEPRDKNAVAPDAARKHLDANTGEVGATGEGAGEGPATPAAEPAEAVVTQATAPSDDVARTDAPAAAAPPPPPPAAAPEAKKDAGEDRQPADERRNEDAAASEGKAMIGQVEEKEADATVGGARSRAAKRPAAPGRSPARMLAKRAAIELEADEPAAVRDRIASSGQSVGGYVETRGGAKTASGQRGITITIRVPSERFESVVQTIRSLAIVRDLSTSAEDLGPKLAEIDAKASKSDRAAEGYVDSTSKLARDREELLNRVKMASIRVTIASRPTSRSSVVEPPRPAIAETQRVAVAATRVDGARDALRRGVAAAADLLFLALLFALENGPSAALVGGGLYAGMRLLRYRRPGTPSRARATSPLA
jgi:hypothetical protein